MNIASAINFGLAALNLGVMIWAAKFSELAWIISLPAMVFCFCMGLCTLDQ